MDNRIRFSPTPIDFAQEVGLTGQDHDVYPKVGQARYDWMRMFLIGLLANQSAEQAPQEYRVGTIWYDIEAEEFKYHDGISDDIFVPLSDGIKVTVNGNVKKLSEWIETVDTEINNGISSATIEGTAASYTSVISVPVDLEEVVSKNKIKPVLFKNGALIKPSLVNFDESKENVILTGAAILNSGDEYIIIFKRVDLVI